MTEVLHANIFFFIASIAVVLFTLLVCVLVWNLIKIVKSIRRIVERVEAGADVLVEEIDQIRSSLNPARLIEFVMSIIPGMPKKRRRRKQTDDEY